MNLNQVTIPSTNVPEAAAFYLKLGLRIIVEAFPRYARFECPEGDATFSIHQVNRRPDGDGILIYFECTDLDIRVRQLLDKGIAFDSLPEDQRWLWREAHLRDPDNNHIVLYYAGENRKSPPWRI